MKMWLKYKRDFKALFTNDGMNNPTEFKAVAVYNMKGNPIIPKDLPLHKQGRSALKKFNPNFVYKGYIPEDRAQK